MSYIYKLKEGVSGECLKELGYEALPESICPAPENENFLFKMVLQPADSGCVKFLIDFYNQIAPKICADSRMRKVHADIGIKFRKIRHKDTYKLCVDEDLMQMFRAWRIEIDTNKKDIYFTISDGSLPSFYDAEQILDKYCPCEIKELVLNNFIEKEAVPEMVQ